MISPLGLARKASRQVPRCGKLVVGFDESCGICQRFARIVKILDWRRLIVADGAHSPGDVRLRAVPLDRRIGEMIAIDTVSGRVTSGFEAVRNVLSRLPICLPLRPLLALVGGLGLGDALYRRIALSRWRSRCARGTCRL